MKFKIKFSFLLIISGVILLGCNQTKPAKPIDQITSVNTNDNSDVINNIKINPPGETTTGISNPASSNCLQKGGKLEIENKVYRDKDFGQIGICYFEDNRQCEEWALFRGDCPLGGLKVTGYITQAARFCAITGGEYKTTKVYSNGAVDDEDGTCTFKNAKVCNVWSYFKGDCSAN